MTAVATILILIILFVLDAWTTAYLAANFEGKELNPFIDTTNFASILFSPINFLVIAFVFFCLLYTEKKKSELKIFIESQSLKLTLFIFPIYFVFVKLLAVINNLFPIAGYSTPIHYFRIPFSGITGNPFLQLVLVNTVIGVLLAPFLIFSAKLLYGEKAKKNEEHDNNSANDARHPDL
ncbi:MAG: hypothetical protein Q8L20_13585 [Gammaproteobacteria bacterium]|nr:hypothetical protein [Gammaproteobacteria bacterium]